MSQEEAAQVNPVVTVADDALYFVDKNRAERKIFYFDLIWYTGTALASLLKLNNFSPSKGSAVDVNTLLIIFAIPILAKHLLRWDFYSTLYKFTGYWFKKIAVLMKILFILSVIAFVMILLNSTYISNNEWYFYSAIIFHIIVILIGVYDKIAVKTKPNFEEERSQQDE